MRRSEELQVLLNAWIEIRGQGFITEPDKITRTRWNKAFGVGWDPAKVLEAPPSRAALELDGGTTKLMIRVAQNRATLDLRDDTDTSRFRFHQVRPRETHRLTLYHLVRICDSLLGHKAGRTLRAHLKEAGLKYSAKRVIAEADKHELLGRLVNGPFERLRQEALARDGDDAG